MENIRTIIGQEDEQILGIPLLVNKSVWQGT